MGHNIVYGMAKIKEKGLCLMNFSDALYGSASVRYRTGRSRTAGQVRRGAGGSSSKKPTGDIPVKQTGTDQEAAASAKASLAAWGYVFQINTQTVAVGANVTFSNNGPLNNINHTPGSAGIDVTLGGAYNITFGVYTTQNNPQDWAVVVNGVVKSRFNSAGQSITGTTSLALNAQDRVTIRNVNTIPDPATLRTGDFTTAYVLLYKVDS